MSERRTRRDPGDRGVVRWECHCQSPPVLLGTYDATGTVHIKVRDRYWHVVGIVKTACPRCGAEHVLPSRPFEQHLADSDHVAGAHRS